MTFQCLEKYNYLKSCFDGECHDEESIIVVQFVNNAFSNYSVRLYDTVRLEQRN